MNEKPEKVADWGIVKKIKRFSKIYYKKDKLSKETQEPQEPKQPQSDL